MTTPKAATLGSAAAVGGEGEAATARALAHLPAHQLSAMLSAPRRRAVTDLVHYILTMKRGFRSAIDVIEDLCKRINDVGVPLDRYGSSTQVLTPEHDATARVWTKDLGVEENVYVRPVGEDPNYNKSPLFEAAKTGEWLELWLPSTPDDRFGIVRELKEAGYTHYLCMPFVLSNDGNAWITMATEAPDGFEQQDLATIALLVPALERYIDARVGWMTLDRLLRTYVGDEPHRAILAGNVKRGQVSTIRSAILFADMRDSTGMTAEISAVQAVELFNDFFDNLVPPIEARGGEVLKYLGDGLLAIFRGADEVSSSGVGLALAAAKEMMANMVTYNEQRPGVRPIEFGVALHFGEAAYGNVGSGQRLDFTVIGRDIGLASRIGAMNARLGEPILMSQAFADRLGQTVDALGAFPARGFTKPIAVFRPPAQ